MCGGTLLCLEISGQYQSYECAGLWLVNRLAKQALLGSSGGRALGCGIGTGWPTRLGGSWSTGGFLECAGRVVWEMPPPWGRGLAEQYHQ